MKPLNNLPITPKISILVAISILGLFSAGLLAAYLMQKEMINSRVEQTRAIVDIAKNFALGLQKQAEAGQLTKEAAIAEFSRRAQTMTYDKGAGYIFANTMDGVAVASQDPKTIGVNRLDGNTNGRALIRELRDGVAANGDVVLRYEFMRPGEKKPIRKLLTSARICSANSSRIRMISSVGHMSSICARSAFLTSRSRSVP